MNIDLESIEIPSYPSGSYNFIRRLRNITIPKHDQPPEHCSESTVSKNGTAHSGVANGMVTNRSTGQDTIKLEIAIIGAGVGGLSNAIALKQAGHDVVVYEQASALSEVGAGIQIPPNSTRILHSWGLKTALERRSVIPHSLLWRRWESGAIIGRARLNPESMQLYGSPYYVTHRAHLHDVLHERTKELGVPIYLKKRVNNYEVERGEVTFDDGEVVMKDLVIAADGLKSSARHALNGTKDKGPQGHGLAAYRGTISMADIKSDPLTKWIAKEPDLNLWVGDDLHVMAYMISGGELFNVVLTHPRDQVIVEDKPMRQVLEEMRSYYKGWDPSLIGHSRVDNSLTQLLDMVTSAVDWPINCIEVPPIWASSSGKLVITGDAAHAMVPYMALGAAMAVEDAAAMAATLTHLRSKDDLKTAVSKWVEARKPRVKQIHEASYGHGLILHLPDGPVQEARDQALRPEVEGKAVTESPNQWSDPVMSHFAYSHDPVAEIERIWGE